MEEYKLIKNFESYSISNLGNVKNNNTNKIHTQKNTGCPENETKFLFFFI